jgi:hypothetical protein
VLRGYVYTTIDDERGTIKEPATALRITGEEGNIEAIEYFTSVFGSFSRANNKKSVTPTFNLYFRDYYNLMFNTCV